MATWQFWAFVSATTLRQIPHLYLEWRMRGRRKSPQEGGRLSTLAMYACYVAIWLVSISASYRETYAGATYILGGVLLLAGITLRLLGLWSLGKNFSSTIALYESQHLITTGVYRCIRHPLHLALLLELAGMLVFSGAWRMVALWACWVALLLVIRSRNKREDAVLRERFGRAAIMYQRAVPSMHILAGVWKHFWSSPQGK